MANILSCSTITGLVDTLNGMNKPLDAYRIALIRPGHKREYGPDIVDYYALGDDEVVAPGYSAGGIGLTGRTAIVRDGVVSVEFDPIEIPASSIKAVGGLIYNSNNMNRVLTVLSFGGVVSSTKDVFTITGPKGSITAVRLKPR